jgi:multiple sugar transport system permease protein
MTTSASTAVSVTTPRERSLQLRRAIGRILDYGLMTALAIFFLVPIWIMIVASVKPERNVMDDIDTIYAFIPRNFTTENYSCPDYNIEGGTCTAPGITQLVPFGLNAFNSVFIVTATVMLGLFVNSMAGFALARLRWRGQKIVLALIIALIIIPFEAIAIPLLLLVNSLPWVDGRMSWINSYHVQIIPFAADAFSIFLFYQFFINIPRDFDEAALVDGASHFMIFWRIIVPLSRPVFATVAIIQFLFQWGSYLWPLITTQGATYRPLTVAMNVIFGQQPIQWGDIMAFASLVTVPVLIVFIIFQRYFIQSVASSGVKG